MDLKLELDREYLKRLNRAFEGENKNKLGLYVRKPADGAEVITMGV